LPGLPGFLSFFPSPPTTPPGKICNGCYDATPVAGGGGGSATGEEAAGEDDGCTVDWMESIALGGRGNLHTLDAVAFMRLRVELADEAKYDDAAAKLAGVVAVMHAAPGVLHLIVGDKAGEFASAMKSA